MVRDESNHAEASDHTAPFDLLDVSTLIILAAFFKVLRTDLHAWEKVLTLAEFRALFGQSDELAIAVVNQLDEDVFTAHTCCPVVQHYFKEVAH